MLEFVSFLADSYLSHTSADKFTKSLFVIFSHHNQRDPEEERAPIGMKAQLQFASFTGCLLFADCFHGYFKQQERGGNMKAVRGDKRCHPTLEVSLH